MPEPLDLQTVAGYVESPGAGHLDERMRRTPGLATMVAEAEAIWRQRAVTRGSLDDSDHTKPGWRTFEDAFPTFYEFTNRPR
jgi:hypothetical protein